MVNISELIENGKVYFSNLKNRDDLYAYLANDLQQEGYVKDTFLDALKTREANFPTGIVSHDYNIALPHVDAEHVKKNALIIVILNEPIKFNRMDKLDEVIDVKVIFMLLIKDVKYHMQAISDLTKLWFNNEFMTSVLTVKSNPEFIELVRKYEV